VWSQSIVTPLRQRPLLFLHPCPTSCPSAFISKNSFPPHLVFTPLPPACPSLSPFPPPTGLPPSHLCVLPSLLNFCFASWTAAVPRAHLFLLHRGGSKDTQVVPVALFRFFLPSQADKTDDPILSTLHRFVLALSGSW